jgi:hypothetical protein
MSACPPHIFLRCASLDGRFAGFTGAVGAVRRNVSTEGEPLAPYAGAAAFLIARNRSFTRPRTSIKEPIEDQANRHL